jgi:hypothetical protein
MLLGKGGSCYLVFTHEDLLSMWNTHDTPNAASAISTGLPLPGLDEEEARLVEGHLGVMDPIPALGGVRVPNWLKSW